jgi:hypothetical protein
MVSPTARIAKRIGIRPPKEVRLNVHLLNFELVCLDASVNPLVARIEPARMTAHRHESRLLLRFDDAATLGKVVAQRDLNFDMFSGMEAGNRLRCMHLGWCGQHNGVDLVQCEALGQIGRNVPDSVPRSNLLGRFKRSANDRHNTHIFDLAHSVKVFYSECAGTRQRDINGHGFSKSGSVKMR